MAAPEIRAIEEGFSKLAHAVRRSTALTVAMHITPEGSSEEEMFATADRCATWLKGNAEEAAGERPRWTPPTS